MNNEHPSQQALTHYEIVVDGAVETRWSEWLAGLDIRPVDAGHTVLRGPLPDQAALLGVLKQLHNLGVQLSSLRRVTGEANEVGRMGE